jgi:CitMHS family citrate-Mg2+:H+ or citrate-Ca2+:H+ symporter
MLALYGFATIIVFRILIITKRLSVITALVLVPIVFAVSPVLTTRKSAKWR